MSDYSEINRAVNDALKGMLDGGCSSCSAFPACRRRLLATARGVCLSGPPGRASSARGSVNVCAWLGRFGRALVRRFRRGVLAALSLFAFVSLADSDVVCSLSENNGQYTYCCSGTGIGEDGTLVNNMIGVCTNCLAMTPEQAREWKIRTSSEITSIANECVRIHDNALSVAGDLSSIVEYTSGAPSCPLSLPVSSASQRATITNWIYSSAVPYGGDFLIAADSSSRRPGVNDASASVVNAWAGSYEGARNYALLQSPALTSASNNLETIASDVESVEQSIRALQFNVQEISEEACNTAFNAAVSGGGSGVGGGSSTNSGNWCTFEQAQAIIELLQDLKEWEEKKQKQINGVSNEVVRVRNTIKNALYSDYTHVPRNTDWQDVYISGSSTGWGYEPSNILQRIELLVYGISGISTNGSGGAWGDDTTPDPESQDFSDAQDYMDTMESDADDHSSDIRSIKDKLTAFFQVFNGLEGDSLRRGDIFIDDIPFTLNDVHYTVPAITSSDGPDLVETFNSVQGLVRTFCTVVYLLSGAFLVFYFWRWFAGYAIKFTKWATEILTSLFTG